MRRAINLLASLGLLGLSTACGPADHGTDEQDVVVDTESELAWQQYAANLAFAKSYEARCDVDAAADADHRVLVTGFGRFLSNSGNATGEMVSALLDELEYPLTEAPGRDEVDPPGPQTAVAQGIIELEGAGTVAVCAMVLPVYWDLAPYLVAKEIQAFAPEMVLMNGIAGWRQNTWLEMGAINSAKRLSDGSDISSPLEDGGPLVPNADESEHARPNLASWEPMKEAMLAKLEEHGEVERDGTRFDRVVRGISLAGFPRVTNTYLCNNVTYTVGYLMDHHDEEVTLMEASHVREGEEAGLPITLGMDTSNVPRLFMHWASDVRGEHVALGAEMLASAIDAQLMALSSAEDGPIRGDNTIADIAPSGGSTF